MAAHLELSGERFFVYYTHSRPLILFAILIA